MDLAFATLTGSFATPLLAGDAGIEQTISLIREVIDEALKSPRVNRVALDAIRHVPAYDALGEVRAIYDWVHANIRFVSDPLNKETVRTAEVILDVGQGDCDDINGVLLPALFGSVGYQSRLVTIAANPASPTDFSHVYPEVYVNGQWVPADAARPGASFGTAVQTYYRKRVWSLTDNSYEDLAGVGCNCGDGCACGIPAELRDAPGWIQYATRGLGSTMTLGQDDSDLADIIRSAGGAATNIIRAVEHQPLDPYASFRTSYSPPGPTAGYQYEKPQDNTWLWVIGGGVALWALMGREK